MAMLLVLLYDEKW